MYLSPPIAFVLAGVALCGSSAAMLQQPQQISLGDLDSSVSTNEFFPESEYGRGRLITIPPRSTDIGLKKVPDADHPYKAPGKGDLRGPCPGLNTLANYGYLPRNGIVTVEDIVNGTRDGFNMDHDLALVLASFAILSRGNAFTNQLSIGGPSHLIPVLPGKIDGPAPPGGLAMHGRFENDVSLTRRDHAVGDSVNFQEDLFDGMLLSIGQFGDDSPITGNRSIVTQKALAEYKFTRSLQDQKENPNLEFHPTRWSFSYGEVGFILSFFPNGTDNVLSVDTLTSFFRHQQYPDNWHRRSSPASTNVTTPIANAVFAAHPIPPGANAPNGTYIWDNVSVKDPCTPYRDLAGDNLPATLLNATGILKQNVDLLLTIMAVGFNCTPVLPNGPAGV